MEEEYIIEAREDIRLNAEITLELCEENSRETSFRSRMGSRKFLIQFQRRVEEKEVRGCLVGL